MTTCWKNIKKGIWFNDINRQVIIDFSAPRLLVMVMTIQAPRVIQALRIIQALRVLMISHLAQAHRHRHTSRWPQDQARFRRQRRKSERQGKTMFRKAEREMILIWVDILILHCLSIFAYMFIDINNNFMFRPQNHQATASGSSHHDHPNPNPSDLECPLSPCTIKNKGYEFSSKNHLREHINTGAPHRGLALDDRLAVLRTTYDNDKMFEKFNEPRMAEYRARYLVQWYRQVIIDFSEPRLLV
jgi:hypothetical protein